MAFAGTTVPKLPEGFVDCSYKNDVCSHFEKEWNRYIIEIWIEHDDPAMRESIHQYAVILRDEEECEHEEIVEFTVNDFSAETLQQVSRRLRNEVYKLMKKYR